MLDPRSWFSLLRVFSFREKLVVLGITIVLIGALGYWGREMYLHFTHPLPDYGGKYIEGLIGQPSHVNPLLSQTNPVDADLVKLIYSGLAKYDHTGRIVPDLAKEWNVSEDGREYTVFLRQGVKWHDGEEVHADDVAFTIDLIRDPLYKSPLRLKWPDLEKVEVVDDYTIKFVLKDPYVRFPENFTVGILPKHVWEQVTPDRFPLSQHNLEPVGSGPYMFSKLQKDSDGNVISYDLEAFKEYTYGRPYISFLSFYFYSSMDALASAYASKEVSGTQILNARDIQALEEAVPDVDPHKFSTPQYYVAFFNHTKSKPLAYEEVRRALSIAVDRKAVLDSAVRGYGVPVEGPFLPGDGAYRDDRLSPDVEEANRILDEAGWARGDDGVRTKDGDRLAFTLMTLDLPSFVASAEQLAEQWKDVGAEVSVEAQGSHDLRQNVIQPREYEALLYVQAPGSPPNLYPYWHESQKTGAGLNLSVYSDEALDEKLKELNEKNDDEKMTQLYKEAQDIFLEKNPAVYLFSPSQLYPVSGKVQGLQADRIIGSEDRFSDVNLWYIETKRKFKNDE